MSKQTLKHLRDLRAHLSALSAKMAETDTILLYEIQAQVKAVNAGAEAPRELRDKIWSCVSGVLHWHGDADMRASLGLIDGGMVDAEKVDAMKDELAQALSRVFGAERGKAKR